MSDLAVTNASAVMTCPDGGGLGIVHDVSVVILGGKVASVGGRVPVGLPRLDAAGGLVTPGLVDAHAHPVFGGSRAGEFALRSEGKTYLEIAAAGGGIRSTVAATRAATTDELVDAAVPRLARALAHGTTTMEAKTGYGLSIDHELRLLDAIAALAARQPIRLVPTLLGAHAVPPDATREEWVAACSGPLLEQARQWMKGGPVGVSPTVGGPVGVSPTGGRRGLAGDLSIDVYCDEGAFTLDEARAILSAARAHGFAVRAHAGQFRDLGAAGLVASLGGLSADHLEQVSDAQTAEMAAAGTIATLLAGACVQLRLPPPPVARLRAAGCRFALGTDLNPGSSMTESLPLQMWLAATHLGLTVDETWLAVTAHAAIAAGRPEAGRLVPGAPGDLVVWKTGDHRDVPYRYGANLVAAVVVGGAPIGAIT